MACGSSSPTNGSTTQAIDGEQCDGPKHADGPHNGDPTHCKPAPQPGQPPPETGPCFQAELHGSICLSSDVWSQIASAACGAQGAAVSSSTAGASCGAPTDKPPTTPTDPNVPGGTDGKTPSDGTPVSSSTGIKFSCCVRTQPPIQPPSPCVEIPFDATNVDGKQAAALVCRAKGLELSSIGVSPNGQSKPALPMEAISSQAGAICAQQGLTVGSVNMTPCTASGQNGTDGVLIGAGRRAQSLLGAGLVRRRRRCLRCGRLSPSVRSV